MAAMTRHQRTDRILVKANGQEQQFPHGPVPLSVTRRWLVSLGVVALGFYRIRVSGCRLCLSFKATPKIIEEAVQLGILDAGKALPSEHNNVQGRQVSLLPEGFPYQAFDAITLYRMFQVLLGKHQSDSGMSEIVGRCQ